MKSHTKYSLSTKVPNWPWRWGVALGWGLVLTWLGLSAVTATATGDAPNLNAPLPFIAPDLARALDIAVPQRSHKNPLHIIVILRPLESATCPENNPSTACAAHIPTWQHNYANAKATLSPMLTPAQAEGTVSALRDLWIIHGMALTAQPVFIQQLAASPHIAAIHLDHYEQYLDPVDFNTPGVALPDALPWGLEKIRAPDVWHTLNISGTGAVVAVMDTGAELLHPALLPNYRGNLGHHLFDHSASWFDAVEQGHYPYDDHGHGTHVVGTAVGRDVGVAPDARWIGVKVLSGDGYGYDSWIHAGFQWLMAPGGDPALAPDVMNASWSSTRNTQDVFLTDIQRLIAVGIMPVFANGNEGPGRGSVGSPASLPGIVGVGASDMDDESAPFSGRGPSPWGEIKPYLSAPGVNVISSLPGGTYGPHNGTSMATPHVVGTVALLRAISPTVPVTTMLRVLTETVVPLGETLPNNDSGWGRLDAFAAATHLMHAGLITGTVRAAHGTLPLRDVTVAATARGTGRATLVPADREAAYQLALAPGLYAVTATAFGYQPRTQTQITVITHSTQTVDFVLTPLPHGEISGRVTVLGIAQPPTRTVVIQAVDTPVSATVTVTGDYHFTLPVGDYCLEARGLGYRITTHCLTVTADAQLQYNFQLPSAPTILLVDEGAWYYGSQTAYWRGDLAALAYAYDAIRIKQVPQYIPISTTLNAYDIVLWSSPHGSPGLVQAGSALQEYMAQGGRLLLSGQNVAYYDGGGSMGRPMQPYLYTDIGAAHTQNVATAASLQGRGVFAGLTITITGGAGADNQDSPDAVAVQNAAQSELVWRYTDGRGAGVAASVCVPQRALFFAYGYEAINDVAQRQTVLARSLDWLMQSQLTQGVRLTRQTATPQIALPGHTVTHTLTVQHSGYAGDPVPLTLWLDDVQWPTMLTPTHLTLAPCETRWVTVTTTIPPDEGWQAIDEIQVRAQQASSTISDTRTLRSKTPAPVLLVDDDRWYNMEAYYTRTLASLHIPFDIWDNDHSSGGYVGATSPPTATLQQYALVVWYTAYDWVRPILDSEAQRLQAYLDRGGRLFLSSQEFLYYHEDETLAELLGVQTWAEGYYYPKQASGVPDQLAGGQWGPVALDYPFLNWSDVVEPRPNAFPLVRGDKGQPLAIAARSGLSATAKSVFYGFPAEVLPDAERAQALGGALDWLSPIGDSTWTLHPTPVSAGGYVSSVVVLQNDDAQPLSVTLAHPVPPALRLITDTHAVSSSIILIPPSPGLAYTPESRMLNWAGWVVSGSPVTLTWMMRVSHTLTGPLVPTLTIGLPEWQLSFVRQNQVSVEGGSLAASAWLSVSHTHIAAGRPLTVGLQVRNSGMATLTNAAARVWLMRGFAPLTATRPPTQGVALTLWEGVLAPGATRTLTVPLAPLYGGTPLRVDALLADTLSGQRWEKRLWLTVTAWDIYLPIVLQTGP